ncbi:MAG: 30S ribosomal protein S1 [Deltaproteobacteria bacterium HGW-Deltaproteobacteria-15]|jgi:small subunit ribosomal protein S1|nr:MAG: 30S ribosomal protein S1 [Deltaproteobacteria bacterium HGW-Deltaproteobacteria-15]
MTTDNPSDIQEDVQDSEEKSFAELMESYEGGRDENIRVGDRISGKILSIGKDAVFVDTGTKIDGAVDRDELVDEHGVLPYQVGDTLELYVASKTGDEIRLSRTASKTGGFQALISAKENSVPVEGKVKGLVKGGFFVEIMKKRAFCPMGQMGLGYVDKPEDHVGKTYPFLITQLEERGKNIVVSRRELLRAEQAKVREEFLKGLAPGAELDGRITRLMPYGAFVEIFPGLEGMVHLSELSWSRVNKPEEVVSKDQMIRVRVISIDKEAAGDRMRISLSAKQVTGDPWENLEEKFHPGDRLQGKVTRCAKFGAFVEIAPGVEGLVHISEMSYRKRVMRPEDVANPGDIVEVLVKEIDSSKRRISLSIRDAEGDPWADVDTRFQVGQIIEGTVEKKERFGWFVNLAPGITGLLPKSRMMESGAPGTSDKIREGESLKVLIEMIQSQERRITLGPADRKDEDDWRKFAATTGKKTLGSLGERLQSAMKSKESQREKVSEE